MTSHCQKTYRPWNPLAAQAQSYSPGNALPHDDLVFFLLDLFQSDALDLSSFYAYYEDESRGAPPFEPAMMLTLLVYAYCVGVFSSRKIALACERNLAFLAIVGDQRPDFRTISDFRKIHFERFEKLFIEVLRLAGVLGMVSLGNLATDGTKMSGNASRHKAMSYGYLQKEEQRLQKNVAKLLSEAQATDATEEAVHGARRGDELPDELKFQQQRLEKIQQAKHRLEQQAQEQADAKTREREQARAQRQQGGEKISSRQPKPIDPTPEAKAQTNFTDPELKIMPQSNKGWEYGVNAQATVDEKFQIIVTAEITTQCNDKEQAGPMAEQTQKNLKQAGIAIPVDEATGEEKKIPHLYDAGYYSQESAEAAEANGMDPYMATQRQKHHEEANSTGENAESKGSKKKKKPTAAEEAKAEAKQKMQEKVSTEDGKKRYAKRKTIVEPVFGQIKGARGFRRFSVRGKKKIAGEWKLVTLTHNLLKLWRYRCAPIRNQCKILLQAA